MRKLLFLMCCLLLLSSLPSYAQDEESYPSVTIPNTEARNIYSEIVDQDYEISVALPSDYHESDDVYPVLYLLDRGFTLEMVTPIVQLDSWANELPELIIVGIGYPDNTEVSWRGLAERDQLHEPDNFLRFINEELTLFIDSTYRTDPTERAIVGWTDAGFFVLYSLFQSPEKFNRYMAIAPSLPGNEIYEIEESFSASHTDLPARLFLSDETSRGRDLEHLSVHLEDRAYGGLAITTLLIEDVNLSTEFTESIARGLNAIYCNDIKGCAVAEPLLQVAAESIYTPGEVFTTPDAFLSLAPSPGSFDLGGTCSKQSEVTVLQVAADENGNVWLELECGRSSGWVKESDLAE